MKREDFPTWDLSLDVAAFMWPAENPKANLLLQHGLGEYTTRYIEQYSKLIPTLNSLGFNVYAIDLPGHGFSKGSRGLVDLNQGVDLHLAAREAIPKDLPLYLFGHSLGGLVTAGSIMREQAGVTAAILSSSAMQKPSSLFERVLSKVMARLAPNGPMPLPRPGLEALSRDPEVVAAAAVDPMFYQGKARNLVAKTTLDVSDAVWAHAKDWAVPTLFIHGDKDTSTNFENSVSLHKAISSKDKTLMLYPGGFHELLNDTIKDQVLSDLVNWLSGQLAK